VGIDQSYSGFGLTMLFPAKGSSQTVVKSFGPKQVGASGVHQLVEIKHWLSNELSPWSPVIAHVAMEDYSYQSKFGREKAGELGGIVKQVIFEMAWGLARYPTIVAIPHVKLWATGSGKATKPQMKQAVHDNWGVTFTNDNAADAFTLAKIAEALTTGETETDAQKKVLPQLRRYTEAPELTNA
jgi:Holliday junction resolvasome RuvABC endonuclease subunit